MSSFSNCYLVYFDLEATGLTIPPDIIQIGAVIGSESFDQYLKPTKPIEKRAAKVIGMHTDKELNIYQTKTGQKLPCRDARTVLTEFLAWLRLVSRGRKVALVAYNAFRFDAIVLLYHMERLRLCYSDVIHGFVDPYCYVCEVRTDLGERQPGKKAIRGVKQSELMNTLGVEASGDGHNAKWDADNLRKLTARLVLEKGEESVDKEETKRRLLAVKGAGKIFVKTTKQFKADLKKKPDGRERVWRKYF